MAHNTRRIPVILFLASVFAVGCSQKEEPDQRIQFEPTTFPSSVSLRSGEGTTVLTFTINRPWRLEVVETRSSSEWCSVDPSSGGAGDASVTVSVTPNMGQEARSCSLSLYAEDELLESIMIQQEGMTEESFQRSILTAFFQETGGNNWTVQDNWCSDKPLNQWYGVETDAAGGVVGIDLRENGLIGHIPASVTQLSKLRSLILKNNGLSSVSVDNPIPEIWKETWGDILCSNKVDVESFKKLGIGLPDRIRALIPENETTYLLLWDPRKGDLTEEEYEVYMENVDAFRGIVSSGIAVIGLCSGIPKQELADSVSLKEIPWKNEILETPWPVHDYPAVGWVKIDKSGAIDDTNLLETRSRIPEEKNSLWAEVVSYDWELASPSLSSRDLNDIFRITYGPGPGRWEVVFSPLPGWMKIMGDKVIVNGNPTTSPRWNRIRVKVYYNGLLLKRASAKIWQPGVFFKATSPSNEKDFTLMEDWNISDATTTALGFTPYPDSQVLVLETNADGLFDPLNGPVSPGVVTGDGFRADGAIPDVTVTTVPDRFTFIHHYSSNRSFDYRACFLTYYPFVDTIEDWHDMEIYHHLVENSIGEIVYHMAACIQTPVRMFTDYDSYLSEAIASPYSEKPGYNLAEVYDNLSLRHKVADRINVSSNVDWNIKSVSLDDEAWQYTVSGGTDEVYCDGKTFRKEAFRLFVNDYLKTKVNDSHNGPIYRVKEYTPSRSTMLRAEVNLRDMQPPLTIELAGITQVGLPLMYFTGWEAPVCPQGEYEFNGHLYKFKTDYTISFAFEMDDLTRYFVGNQALEQWAHSLEGETYYNSGWGWFYLPNNASSYSASVFWDFNFMLSFDLRMVLSTGVEVYAASRRDCSAEVISLAKRALSQKRPVSLLEKPIEEYCRPVSLKKIPKPITPKVHVTDRVFPSSGDGLKCYLAKERGTTLP